MLSDNIFRSSSEVMNTLQHVTNVVLFDRLKE